MRREYSLYEAKAKLSALVREVRQGHSVVITVHGEPAAVLGPVEEAASGLEGRVRQLAARGAVRRREGPAVPLKRAARKPGALKRFLDERE